MNVLLWHKDKPSGHCGVSAPKHTNWFAFFKVHRARCLFLFIFFQIKRGWRKFVSVYCCRDNRLHTGISTTTLYAILVNQTTLKLYSMTLLEFLSIYIRNLDKGI